MTIALYAPCGDKKEHDVAVMLKNALLSAFFPSEKSENIFYYAASGRPMLTLPGCDLSVSHSHGAASVALSLPGVMPLPAFDCGELLTLDASEKSFQIGLDIETSADKKQKTAEKVARREFTAGEMAYLEKASGECGFQEAFVRVWTRKEALVKLTGEGLAGLGKTDSTDLSPGLRLFTQKITVGGKDYILSAALRGNSED